MFAKLRNRNVWKFEGVSDEKCIQAQACVEFRIPLQIWRMLVNRSDGQTQSLGSKAETWEFEYKLKNREYALAAVFEGEHYPVVFFSDIDIYMDFVEWLKEGLQIVAPMPLDL